MSAADTMKTYFATSFAFYLKTHYYHWNIEGEDFPQYHKLLEDAYVEVYSALDAAAEFIRTLGQYAPGSFNRFIELSRVQDATTVPPAKDMLQQLLTDNAKVLETIRDAYDSAEAEGEHGLSNFLADRQAAHKKLQWFLMSTLKNS